MTLPYYTNLLLQFSNTETQHIKCKLLSKNRMTEFKQPKNIAQVFVTEGVTGYHTRRKQLNTEYRMLNVT